MGKKKQAKQRLAAHDEKLSALRAVLDELLSDPNTSEAVSGDEANLFLVDQPYILYVTPDHIVRARVIDGRFEIRRATYPQS